MKKITNHQYGEQSKGSNASATVQGLATVVAKTEITNVRNQASLSFYSVRVAMSAMASNQNQDGMKKREQAHLSPEVVAVKVKHDSENSKPDSLARTGLTNQGQSVNQVKTDSRTAGPKPAQTERKTMKTNLVSNGAAASNGKNNSNLNVSRSSTFSLFKKPEIAPEGQLGAVITDVVEVRVEGTETVHLEITVQLDPKDGKSFMLVKSYNMSENARGQALFLKDYNTLTGADLGRYELYKADPSVLKGMRVVVEISHKNATKLAEAVIKSFLPAVVEETNAEAVAVAETAPVSA